MPPARRPAVSAPVGRVRAGLWVAGGLLTLAVLGAAVASPDPGGRDLGGSGRACRYGAAAAYTVAAVAAVRVWAAKRSGQRQPAECVGSHGPHSVPIL